MIYFVFDTETTDLVATSLRPLNKQPYICEFYGVQWDSEKRKVVGEIDFICRPPKGVMTEGAIKAHGWTDETLKDYPPFAKYAQDVRKIIEGSDAVVAHNLAFDFAVTTNEMVRNDIELQWPIRRICTVENTEHIKGYRLSLGPKKKEEGLHYYLFNEHFEEAHHAKNDAQALLRCFIELLDREII